MKIKFVFKTDRWQTLRKSNWYDTFDYDATDNKLIVIIANTMEDEEIGQIAATLDEEVAYMHSLVVKPNYRNQKLGQSLIRQLEQFVARQGYDELWLQVEAEEKDNLIPFYEKLGFEIVDFDEEYNSYNVRKVIEKAV